MKMFLTGILISINFYGFGQETIEGNIRELTNIKSIKKIEAIGEFKDCYELLIEQPINHDDPDQGSFLQKIYLSHKDINKPMVLVINGYISFDNIVNEWSEILDANQIYVEHRYFGKSKPEKIVWETLNLKNACSDLHKIRLSFKSIYQNKWISTGISKGGLTAVTYKYFFPNDISATIALSTSVKTSNCDTTFFTYIDSLSKKNGCFEELKDFQKILLKNRKELISIMINHFEINQIEYHDTYIDKIFDCAVMEIPFSIWQNNSGCEIIKNLNIDTPDEMFNSMRIALKDWFMTKRVFDDMEAFHYQAMTELGYYCYPTSFFKDLLNEQNEILTFISHSNHVHYSNELMLNLRTWLTNHGNNIIYITGKNDPYSIYRIQPNKNLDVLSIELENRNHNQVYFKNLDINQRKVILRKIKEWTY